MLKTSLRLLFILFTFIFLAQNNFSIVICYAKPIESKNQVIEVPFEFYRNEIILQVKINGKGSFNMMLDTGTDPSVIDLATAKKIGLKMNSIGQVTGGGTGANSAYETAFSVVQVGRLKAKNVEALAFDLSEMSGHFGKPLHGIFGHSLLNNRILQIDYPKRVVRFFSKSPFLKTANQSDSSKLATLNFRYDDNILIDDGIFVNGKKMTANFDTGSDGTFKLTPDAISVLGLSDEVSKMQASQSVGYNGTSENREGKIKKVTIGGISVDEPTAIFFGKGTGRDKKPWGINIGNAFLQNFVVTINYTSKTIRLEKP